MSHGGGHKHSDPVEPHAGEAMGLHVGDGTEPPVELVHHPAHYGGDTTYETIKVIRAWDLGFNLGTVVKHISRAGKKPGADLLTDLRKARWYLDDEIRHLEEEHGSED